MAKVQELVQKYWWIGAGVAFFWLWLRQHDAAIIMRADADRRVDSMRVEILQLKHASEMAELNHKLERANRDVVIAQQSAASVARTAEIKIRNSENTLRAELTERQNALLDSIVGGYQAQLAATKHVIDVMAAEDTLQRIKIDSLEHVNVRLLNAAVAANQQSADLVKRLKPSFASRVLGWVPLAILAATRIF